MEHSLTTGNLKKALILFAVPLFFSQLFQTLYNTADTVIIGHYLGDLSLAAVGAAASLFELIVGFCTGFGQGLGVVAAQKYGAGEMHEFRRSIALSIVLSLGLSVLLAVGMKQCLESVLNFMQTPADIFGQSYSYILVITLGLPITMFYNLCAGMLRAAGDSVTPLVILLISSALNIVLDIAFITLLHTGVEGTAWATLIAQLISLIICLIWIAAKKRELVPGLRDFAWHGSMAQNLLEMGFSMALMSSIVSLGTVILQIGINPLGTLIITGHTAARKLVSILSLPLGSMTMALSSFAAQNTGAGEYERAEQGIAFANRLGVYYSIGAALLVFFCSRWLIAMISGSNSPEVLDTGSLYLITNIPFFPVLAILLNLRTSLQGMSMKLVPVVSSVIELTGKLLFTWMIVPIAGYYGICASEPVIWICMAVYLAWFYLRNPLFKKHQIKAHILW